MIIPRKHRLIYQVFACILLFSGVMDLFFVRFYIPNWTIGVISFIFGGFILYFCRLFKGLEVNES